MITINERELTKNERKKLKEDRISEIIGDVENFTFSFFLVLGVFFLVSHVLSKFFPFLKNYENYYTVFNLVISIIITSIFFRHVKREIRDNSQKSLNRIRAEILHVKTSKAIKRQDPEDLGIAFYIEVEDQRTLFLWGQYLDLLEYDKKFPNTEFKIIRRNDTKALIDIITLGEYFEPENELPPFSDEEWENNTYPEDGEILNFSINEIK